MADRTVSGRPSFNVTTDAPPHAQRAIDFLDHPDELNVSVATRALDTRRDVPHVRELHVIGNLIDTVPGNRLLPLGVPTKKLNLLGVFAPGHEVVTTHASRNWRDSSPHRAFSRKVAVLAVDPVFAGVYVVGKSNRLTRAPRLLIGSRGGCLILNGWVFLPAKRRSESEREKTHDRQDGQGFAHDRSCLF